MKKLIFSIIIIAIVSSCGERPKKENQKNMLKDAKKDITYLSNEDVSNQGTVVEQPEDPSSGENPDLPIIPTNEPSDSSSDDDPVLSRVIGTFSHKAIWYSTFLKLHRISIDGTGSDFKPIKVSFDTVLTNDSSSKNSIIMLTRGKEYKGKPQDILHTVSNTRIIKDKMSTVKTKSKKVLYVKDMLRYYSDIDYYEGANFQFSTRDKNNNLWITSHNLNEVLVINPAMSKELGKVSLTDQSSEHFITLDKSGEYSSPSFIMPYKDKVIVFAQKLIRGYENTNFWVPEENSSAAVIDINTKKIVKVINMPIPNVTNAFLIQDPNTEEYFLKVIGSGSLNQFERYGSTGVIDLQEMKLITKVNEDQAKILDSHIDRNGNLALIKWFTKRSESCIYYNHTKILCKGPGDLGDGYIFANILMNDDFIYVSHNKSTNPQIWIISRKNTKNIKIIPIPDGSTANSMIFGP